MCALSELNVICVAERRKAWAEVFSVGAAEGVEAGEPGKVEMIVQAYDVANVVVRIEATGSVGEEDGLDAKYTADPGRVCHGLHRVAFVETGKKERQKYGLRRNGRWY